MLALQYGSPFLPSLLESSDAFSNLEAIPSSFFFPFQQQLINQPGNLGPIWIYIKKEK